MAVFRPVPLFCPLWTFIRHRSKPNIQKTRLPHFVRLKVLETTKPMFVPEVLPDSVTCSKIGDDLDLVTKLTKYESLLAEEALQFMDTSSLIAFFHINSITGRQLNEVKRTLFKNDMSLGHYECSILRTALKETKYAATVPLFDNETAMVFSKEPNVKLMLKLQKKMPQLTLLCGVVDNRLLSREMLEWYSNLPDIDGMRAHLCSTLSSLGVQLAQNLEYHQTQLCHSLSSLVTAGPSVLPTPSDNVIMVANDAGPVQT